MAQWTFWEVNKAIRTYRKSLNSVSFQDSMPLNHIKYIHERMKLQMFRLEKDSSTKEGKRSMLSREVEDVYSFGSRYKT